MVATLSIRSDLAEEEKNICTSTEGLRVTTLSSLINPANSPWVYATLYFRRRCLNEVFKHFVCKNSISKKKTSESETFKQRTIFARKYFDIIDEKEI